MRELKLTHDWISGYWPLWERLIPVREWMRIIEIGCFEGRSTVWLLERFPASFVFAIDTFTGGKDHAEAGVDMSKTEEHFDHNVSPYKDRVRKFKGESEDVLPRICWMKSEADLIIIDGSHQARDVMFDAVVSWRLLKPRGIIIFDDYGWGEDRLIHEKPRPAIDGFMASHCGEFDILECGYQVILQKKWITQP